MPRSYVRLDPGFADRKRPYPDGPYRALIDVFCAAEYEPTRGQFRSMAILRAVIGKSARHLPYLFAKHDIALTADDRIQVVGWDEWQEGNWQVAERMRRVRERREGLVMVPTVTAALQPVDEPTVMASSEQVGGKPLAVSGRPLAATETAPVNDPYDAPEFRAVQWLVGRGCYLPETSGYHRWLIRILSLADDDIETLLVALGKASRAGVKDGDVKGFLTAAEELIRKRPDFKAIEREERQEEVREATDARYHATMRMLERQQGRGA